MSKSRYFNISLIGFLPYYCREAFQLCNLQFSFVTVKYLNSCRVDCFSWNNTSKDANTYQYLIENRFTDAHIYHLISFVYNGIKKLFVTSLLSLHTHVRGSSYVFMKAYEENTVYNFVSIKYLKFNLIIQIKTLSARIY